MKQHNCISSFFSNTRIKNPLQSLVYASPFILMDIGIRFLTRHVNFHENIMIIPNIAFNLIWILLFVNLSFSFKKIVGRIIYCIFFLIFFLLFLINWIYYSYTGFFFNFHLLSLTDEGTSYIIDTIINTHHVVFLTSFFILLLTIVLVIKFPSIDKYHFPKAGITFIYFIALHSLIPSFLGNKMTSLEWSTWQNPRSIYENFNDPNKCMKICGLYEYSFRDFYITFLKPSERENPDEIAFLDNEYSSSSIHTPNEYTGIFKNKNVIFLQLEGLDSWLLNEIDTPTMYSMLNNSIVFTDHYSYYNGGGSTFNSELAVNTGFITPITYIKNGYTFNSNLFVNSLPKTFKNLGYTTSAFHMNSGEYYSRELNYINWGYDNYYGLIDEYDYDDFSFSLDRELILNKTFYKKLFEQEQAFMHYIITYTPHTPFSLDSPQGRLLAQQVYKNEIPDLSEEECARLFASETDYMVKLLLDALESNNLLDNTVIVAFADHYLYTLNDKTILDKYKETDNNLINQTPFFIWSNDIEQLIINKTNSQIDILPTVLNLFGIEYIEDYYIGNDILDSSYPGYVFFSDYSWYDGTIYVENGNSPLSTNKSYTEQMNSRIHNLILKNDLTLKYDYFRRNSIK